jgi:hypothetical protein
MSASVRNPVLSGRKNASPLAKFTTRDNNLASDEQSDDDSIEDSDESDEEASDDISALNNDSLYSADTYAGSYVSDAGGNIRNSTSRSTVSPMQSNRSSSTRQTEPQVKSRTYADEERGLETINEEDSDEDVGKRDDSDDEDSEDDDSSEGSYDSGSSENTSNSEVPINILLCSFECLKCYFYLQSLIDLNFRQWIHFI